jgi:hypothetical protein
MKTFLKFTAKVTVAHVCTYFVVGAVAYQLLTKQFYVGPDPLFASFMRTEADPETWGHVIKWFFPANVLRGLLIACVLYPFLRMLNTWRFRRRFISIAGLYLVFGFWAAAVASPGTLEGMVYLRPEFTPSVHLAVQPEIVVQGLALAAWLAWWITPPPAPTADNRLT